MSKPRVFVSGIICDKGLDLVKDFCEAEIWPEELPPAGLSCSKKCAAWRACSAC